MASSILSSDKTSWMLTGEPPPCSALHSSPTHDRIGIGTLLAIYAAYWQLDTFRKRTANKPPSTLSVGVEQSTEDGSSQCCRHYPNY